MKYITAHAKKRARERYDLRITKRDGRDLVNRIQAFDFIQATRIAGQSMQIRMHIGPTLVTLLYRKKTSTITTFLPLY